MIKLKSRILIIDDSPSNIQIMAELLKNDYEIVFATNGQKGIDIAVQDHPDLIILDVVMPGMNGFEVCTILKQNKVTKSIPVIFVTALDEAINETRGLETGAIDYINKPINADILKMRVKNHIELQMTRRELEAKNKELEWFCFAVSHDLRAPLRRIKTFSQMVVEDCKEKLDETEKSNLLKVSSGCTHMENLIGNLLRFSFISSSELNRSVFSLSKMAEEICNVLKENTENGRFEIDIFPEMNVNGDSELLKVLMTNLLSNAWKFTAKKEKRIIQVGFKEDNNGKVYFVKDNGAGFDMNFYDKMFSVFQRLHAATDFDGNGLGLFISRRIIQKHGGKIWAEGTINAGATFFFCLPETETTS
ncbi:MAG: response regulator [Candidatus Riflebacteria bacterium]|nr:response regulator [Candidatus Riflebacteria bacterium]